MIKSVLLVVLGAIGALEAEERLGSLRARFSPKAVTDAMLDKVNRSLEGKRSSF